MSSDSIPTTKLRISNMKHGGGIKPTIWVHTFGPRCIIIYSMQRYITSISQVIIELNIVQEIKLVQ